MSCVSCFGLSHFVYTTPLVGGVYGIHLKEIHSLLDFTGRSQIGHFSLENMTEARYDDLYVVLTTAVEFGLGQKVKY
jgi:hypothetical protein